MAASSAAGSRFKLLLFEQQPGTLCWELVAQVGLGGRVRSLAGAVRTRPSSEARASEHARMRKGRCAPAEH